MRMAHSSAQALIKRTRTSSCTSAAPNVTPLLKGTNASCSWPGAASSEKQKPFCSKSGRCSRSVSSSIAESDRSRGAMSGCLHVRSGSRACMRAATYCCASVLTSKCCEHFDRSRVGNSP
jgi:hypothetical protein